MSTPNQMIAIGSVLWNINSISTVYSRSEQEELKSMYTTDTWYIIVEGGGSRTLIPFDTEEKCKGELLQVMYVLQKHKVLIN